MSAETNVLMVIVAISFKAVPVLIVTVPIVEITVSS